MEPSDHLFRHEVERMVATLTRVFGVHNLALAEDVVQDAFCRALEVWKFRGVPEGVLHDIRSEEHTSDSSH